MERPKSSINPNASKESDDIEEDSLNISISEHISEEIESNNNLSIGSDDSITDDNKEARFDKLLMTDKKRKLFDIDSDEEEDGRGTAGDAKKTDFSTRFSNFGISNENLDTLLSGDNIAQHFKDADTNTTDEDKHEKIEKFSKDDDENIKSHTKNSFNPKLDENSMNDGANASAAVSGSSIRHISHSKSDNSGISAKSRGVSENVVNEASVSKRSKLQDDVILINDHEISINSLKSLQEQPVEQNTASDVSELVNEENVSSTKGDSELHNSNSGSGKRSTGAKPTDSGTNEISNNKHDIHSGGSTPKLFSRNQSISEIFSINEELDFNQSEENLLEKKGEMRKILNEAIEKLPIDSKNSVSRINSDSIQTVRDNSQDKELILIENNGSQVTELSRCEKNQNRMGSTPSIVTEQINVILKPLAMAKNEVETVSSSATETKFDPIFEKELNINLNQIQNRIRELQDLTAGKLNISAMGNSPFDSESRRDSLKDLPQSGRESSSIITNCTEYKTFQEEYFKVNMEIFSKFVFNSN